MIKRLLFTFLLLVLVSSCAERGTPSSTTFFQLSVGGIEADTLFPGGVIVQGLNQKNGEKIEKLLHSDFEMDIPNGKWAFHIVGFDEFNINDALAYCANDSSVELEGGEVTLEMELRSSSCQFELVDEFIYRYFLPLSPRNIQHQMVSETAVNLTWEAPDNDHILVQDYLIEGAVNGGSYTPWGTASSTEKSFLYDSLAPGETYTFRVLARSERGLGIFSAAQTFETDPPPLPAYYQINGPGSFEAGQCSGEMTITAYDDNNEPIALSEDRIIDLVATDNNIEFYSDTGCTTDLGGDPTFTEGTDTFSFSINFFGHVMPENLEITVADPDEVIATSSLMVDIEPHVDNIELTSAPGTTIAGECSLAFVLEVKDTQGDMASLLEPESFTFTTPMNLSFYSDNNCTNEITQIDMNTGATIYQFYARSESVDAGNISLNNAIFPDPTHAFNIDPGPLSEINTIFDGLGTVFAEVEVNTVGALPIKATAFDQYGNFIPDADLTINIPANGGSVASTTVMTDGSGEAYWSLDSSTVADTYTYEIVGDGGAIISNQLEVTFNPGPLDNISVITSTGMNILSADTSQIDIEAFAEDAYGNPIADLELELIIPPEGGGTPSEILITQNGGNVLWPLEGLTTAGNYSYDIQHSGVTEADITIEVEPGEVSLINFSALGPIEILADEMDQTQLEAVVMDQHNNPVSGVPVDIIIPVDGGTVDQITKNTDIAGMVNWVLTSSLQMGPYDYFVEYSFGPTVQSNIVEISFLATCGPTEEPFGGGDGSMMDPYRICSELHFNNIGNHNESHFVLNDDITLATAYTNVPIPSFFGSIINPDMYTIFGLDINVDTTNDIGMIEILEEGSILENIILDSPSVVSQGGAGALVGTNHGEILNCEIKGPTIQGQIGVGGVVAVNESTGVIDLCHVTEEAVGLVEATSEDAGGVAGWNYGLIQKTLSSVGVQSVQSAGGIVGHNDWDENDPETPQPGRIINSASTGNVHTSQSYAGGIAGLNDGDIKDSYAHGNITGGAVLGGIVGWNDGNITGSYSSSSISGAEVGGVVSWNGVAGVINDAFWDSSNINNDVFDDDNALNTDATGLNGETEMCDENNFPGWGFGADWYMPDTNCKGPEFWWQHN